MPHATAQAEAARRIAEGLGLLQDVVAAGGWTRHLAEPRLGLCALRALGARGRALLRPGVFHERPSPLAAAVFGVCRRGRPPGEGLLPEPLFRLIVCFVWGGY